jgi:hypothetical protein
MLTMVSLLDDRPYQHCRRVRLFTFHVEYGCHLGVGNILSARSDVEPDCIYRPLIGGLLSSPATKWPSIFGRLGIFRDLPYFLPCAAAGVVAFAVYLIALVAFKEVNKLVFSWTPSTDSNITS